MRNVDDSGRHRAVHYGRVEPDRAGREQTDDEGVGAPGAVESRWRAVNMLSPSPPHHRTIFAVDIEGSTTRNNTAKGDLRGAMYALLEQALRANGIDEDFCDPLVDRGDGILALIRPLDEVPKTLLLSKVVPSLRELLLDHEVRHPGQRLRLRAVLHAGEVHHDLRAPFGEALDVAFRLLDAPEVKQRFRLVTDPLLLVVSDWIYRTIVRQGYEGIDEQMFQPVTQVVVHDVVYPGWAYLEDAPAAEVPGMLGRLSASARLMHASRRFEERGHVV
jgi:class 3 adenylate cyclase